MEVTCLRPIPHLKSKTRGDEMKKKSIIIMAFLLSFTILAGSYIVSAKTSDEIIFKDKNLQSALSKYYDWNEAFTKKKASELSQNKDYLILDDADISDLEGLQYFNNLMQINLISNKISNLSVLSELKNLTHIDISHNSINGKDFENNLNRMGYIEKLDTIFLADDEITDIGFLQKIGNIKNYTYLYMENNNIRDISVLKNADNLETLLLSDNRITDVTPLKDLKNFTYWLDLQDNCILDYKPIKPILDKIYEEGGWDGVISRYDYYTNPVDVGVNGKTIKFPYLTAYYKYQAYVEAIPLFKALGGSAKYDKKAGALTCKYNGNVLVMKDFSKNYTLNGKKMIMKYPMRRMQYDLAYVSVKDICKALGLDYSVTKKREIFENEEESFYVPKYIKISIAEKELG